jgi:hypothetical protein
MSNEYKIGIFVGIIAGILLYAVVVWALPIMAKWNWMLSKIA